MAGLELGFLCFGLRGIWCSNTAALFVGVKC